MLIILDLIFLGLILICKFKNKLGDPSIRCNIVGFLFAISMIATITLFGLRNYRIYHRCDPQEYCWKPSPMDKYNSLDEFKIWILVGKPREPLNREF